MRWDVSILPGNARGGAVGGSGSLALPSPFPVASSWQLAVKRAIDVVGAAVLLAALLPLLALSALLICLPDRGPVLYVQRRSGRFGREFRMYKLRTMVPDAERLQDRLAAEQAGRTFLKLKDDPRITRVGGILRKYSIDELPQLLNVLKGEMSLVGPRPLLPCDVRNFPKDDRARRFDMLPGMTGLWQVSGRNGLDDEQRMELDRAYVDHWSLQRDLEILARTPAAVVGARGAY